MLQLVSLGQGHTSVWRLVIESPWGWCRDEAGGKGDVSSQKGKILADKTDILHNMATQRKTQGVQERGKTKNLEIEFHEYRYF